jgi:hypothetical protein
MTVALITETDANPGESGYLAGQLSADGIKVLDQWTADTRVPVTGHPLRGCPPLSTA